MQLLCELLIHASSTEFNHVNLATAFRKVLHMPHNTTALCEEDAALKEVAMLPRYRCASCILETKTTDGITEPRPHVPNHKAKRMQSTYHFFFSFFSYASAVRFFLAAATAFRASTPQVWMLSIRVFSTLRTTVRSSSVSRCMSVMPFSSLHPVKRLSLIHI